LQDDELNIGPRYAEHAGKKRGSYQIVVRKPERKPQFVDLGSDERTILKYI
jgi:hypothetical protein